MKIDRRGFLIGSSSALVLAKSELSAAGSVERVQTTRESEWSVAGREVKVYTTAENTNHRLSATDTVAFKPMGQPLRRKFVSLSIPRGRFKRSWELVEH
jgi:glucosylceramidase